MSGKDLLDHMKRTGTGAAKLAVMQQVLDRKKNASAFEVLGDLKANLRKKGDGVVGEGTIAKAEAIIEGRYKDQPAFDKSRSLVEV